MQLVERYLKSRLSNVNEHKQLEELSNQLSKLQMDLRTVNQEHQATQNQYLITNSVKKMSQHYQAEYGRISAEKKNLPGKTQWKILTEFLSETVSRIETHTPWFFHMKPGTKDTHARGLSINASNVQTHTQEERMQRRRDKIGKCPICQGEHTYKTRFGVDCPSDRLSSCDQFKNLSVEERAVRLESLSGCELCTSTQHRRDKCQSQQNPCDFRDGGVVCSKLHSQMFHSPKMAYVNHVGS